MQSSAIPSFAWLLGRRVLRLAGDDAPAFLQGLVSCDVSRLSEGQMAYGALLSPQGKFLYDFFIARWQEAYWLEVDAGFAAPLRQRLMLYKLRSKVTIEPSDAMVVAACWGAGALPQADGVFAADDPRLGALGRRLMGERQALETVLHGLEAGDYEAHRIGLGIPDGAQDMIQDKSLLLEFGFEHLHGVDFNKGCYVGQEVTARSKFRAQLKKGIYQVRTAQGALPAAGTEIRAGEQVVGELRSSAGGQGLALLRTQELAQAQASGIVLLAGDTQLTAQRPDWMPPAGAPPGA